MRRILLVTLASAVSVLPLTLTPGAAQSDQQPSREERIQRWAADGEMVLGARLAGMKAGLGLNADQEKLWNPFVSAVQDAFKSRMESMQTMMKMREGRKRMSPVDHMEFMASRMAQGAAGLKAVSEAAKPLYASLDDIQKHTFAMLGHGVMMMAEPHMNAAEGVFGGGDTGFSWEPPGWAKTPEE
jgi:zinc resistance-associated protein